MDKDEKLLYYIIGYVLLLFFWVCAWNVIETCLNKITNNYYFLKNNKVLFNLILLIGISAILKKYYNFKFNINN
tara:strand:+ start:9355 stop:9576 length:222 start_codon:yes stop_codon:yes gene_type:complete